MIKSIFKHTAIGLSIATAFTLLGLAVTGIALIILGYPVT